MLAFLWSHLLTNYVSLTFVATRTCLFLFDIMRIAAWHGHGHHKFSREGRGFQTKHSKT